MTSAERSTKIAELTARIKDAMIMAHKANSHTAAVKFMNEAYRMQTLRTKLVMES